MIFWSFIIQFFWMISIFWLDLLGYSFFISFIQFIYAKSSWNCPAMQLFSDSNKKKFIQRHKERGTHEKKSSSTHANWSTEMFLLVVRHQSNYIPLVGCDPTIWTQVTRASHSVCVCAVVCVSGIFFLRARLLGRETHAHTTQWEHTKKYIIPLTVQFHIVRPYTCTM